MVTCQSHPVGPGFEHRQSNSGASLTQTEIQTQAEQDRCKAGWRRQRNEKRLWWMDGLTDSSAISQLGFPAGDPRPPLETFWLEGLDSAGKDRQRSRETYTEGHRRPRKAEPEKSKQENWFPSPSPTSFRVEPPRPENTGSEPGASERLGRAVHLGLHRVSRLAAAVPGQPLAPLQASPSSEQVSLPQRRWEVTLNRLPPL